MTTRLADPDNQAQVPGDLGVSAEELAGESNDDSNQRLGRRFQRQFGIALNKIG